jgi:hypothetical protein
MTQFQIIENHMIENGSITTLEAFEKYNITRLSKYIEDLRHKYGYANIPDEWETGNGKQWKRYFFKANQIRLAI